MHTVADGEAQWKRDEARLPARPVDGRFLTAFAGLHHRVRKLVQLLDKIDLLVDGQTRKAGASRLFGSEYFL
jgi:hypothetical protein